MKNIILCVLIMNILNANSQSAKIKPLAELINKKEPAWELFLTKALKEAQNPVEVLAKDKAKADSALYKAQVTTRSPLGAVIYETGGILINHGWIRILGSGSKKLDRSVMNWNKGKTFERDFDCLSFVLIADDVLGGFFAVNSGGGLDSVAIGKVFYLAPDNLLWENTNYTYTQFLDFCLNGDIQKYYEPYYWIGWKEDIQKINGNQGISCYPFLWTTEGKDINKVFRKPVPIEELWFINNDFRKQLGIGK
jgi:Protein of unknown function DUF2625